MPADEDDAARSPARRTGSRSSAARSTSSASTASTARRTSSAGSATSSGRASRRASRAASSRSSSTGWRAATETVIFGDGLQVRDFVYVGDVVAALLAAAAHEGGVFNVGSGVETTVLALHEACARGGRRPVGADVRGRAARRPAPLGARRLARRGRARLPRATTSLDDGHRADLGLDELASEGARRRDGEVGGPVGRAAAHAP